MRVGNQVIIDPFCLLGGTNTSSNNSRLNIRVDYTSTEDQKIFSFNETDYDFLTVYSGSLLVRDTEYTVTENGSNTDVEFNEGRDLNTWVSIEYIIDDTHLGSVEFIATEGQDTFIIQDKHIDEIRAFAEGTLVREVEYDLNIVGDDTEIVFNEGLDLNTWLFVELIK